MPKATKKILQAHNQQQLLQLLKERFEKNTKRHAGINWEKVMARLAADPGKLWSLNEMERTYFIFSAI